MHDPRWQALYVHLFNGLYVNAMTNVLVQRWWPVHDVTSRKGARP
jgi:NAD(P)H-quinone oxidoreductase subunit 5